MRPADNIRKSFTELHVPTSARLDEQINVEISMALVKARNKKSADPLPNIWRMIVKNRTTKLAAAAVIIITVVVGIHYLGSSGTSVAFAEVIQRFESVPFFNLTIYVGNDTTAEAQKIEIWKSEKSQVRAHEANKVIFIDFADGNNVFVAFDRSTMQPVNADGIAKAVLMWILGTGKRFSLENIINSLPAEAKDITSVKTADNAASRETVVFEARHRTRPEQLLLIWALRESKLPVRMHFNSHSKYSDFLFDYSQKKDSAFFDSNAFTKQRDR